MSLKQKLMNLIKSRNGATVSLQEVEFVCKQEKHKLSNAERRLRPSESPEIERVFQQGAIIGYRWRTKEDYCSSCGYFMDHSLECETLKANSVKEANNMLF